MDLKCSFLSERTPLVDTKNKLLILGTGLTLQRDSFHTAPKRKYHLTSTECLNSELFSISGKLNKPSLDNKFLFNDKQRNSGIFHCQAYDEESLNERSLIEECLRENFPSAERIHLKCSKKKRRIPAELFPSDQKGEELSQYLLECVGEDSHVYAASDLPPSVCFGSSSFMEMAPRSLPLKRFLPMGMTPRGNEMPVYFFAPLISKVLDEIKFSSVEHDLEFQLDSKIKDIIAKKVCFLNVVTTSLLYSPNFKISDDIFRIHLLKCLKDITLVDPEFVLKVALYARQELNIRSTANFILAYSASVKNCSVYLKKYFSSTIRLPSDWINVAELYSALHDSPKTRFLPAALRKVMKSTFSQFDQYQLAKYNKHVSRKPKKKLKGRTPEALPIKKDVSKNEKSYSLKTLIRLLHISKPIQDVMCILGKKYPSDSESFRQSGLPGIWDSQQSGKRMKLPVPETWETMVAAKGNKADVWESLLDNKKLPYMALLRNLRNMIMAGISPEHHKKVTSLLTKKEAIIKSRQFPIRFYAAFKVIENIQELLNNDLKRKTLKPDTPFWKQKQDKKFQKRIDEINPNILDSYKNALNQAIEISADYNMKPIAGRTLIICDFTDNETSSTGEIASVFSRKFHSSVMLSLMCLRACEDCEVKVLLTNNSFETIKMQSKSLLKNMSDICAKYEVSKEDSNVSLNDDTHMLTDDIFSKQLPELLNYYLKSDVMTTEKLDNIVFMISSENFSSSGGPKLIAKFLYKYRHLVNSDLLYIQTDISSGTESCGLSGLDSYENDIYLRGFSEHMFKFIAERGGSGQVSYVENIDLKYDLPKIQDVRNPDTSCNFGMNQQHNSFYSSPSWKTMRIFISSTFKDMHGERDMLLRYVFPELKARACTLFINLKEVDLRWGITEMDSSSKRCAELCLTEVQNCDFFIGILGERYGTRYTFDGPDNQLLDWVKYYPPRTSITELEMYCGALKDPVVKRERAFFFMRDNSFIKNVPEEWVDDFEAEDSDSKKRLTSLKCRIRNSGFVLYDGYPCHWAGVVNEKPIVAGLDEFGKSVLNNLWNALCKFHKQEHSEDEIMEEIGRHHSQKDLHNFYVGDQSSPINWLLKELKDKNGVFFITGKTGCGKTALIVNVLQNIKGDPVIQYFIGATPRSTDLYHMLYFIAFSVLSILPVRTVLPNSKKGLINNFLDIITEGVKVSWSGNLIIVIDGLDYLDDEAQVLDWLPNDLPSGLKFVFSASESSTVYKNLSNRERYGAAVYFVPLKPLMVTDRQSLVRQYLDQHHKKLDENPFNNQMIHLVSKADGGNPLYLHLACDYLRTFALFENLTNNIRSFPSVLNQVLEKVIVQLEKSHGNDIVETALNLMCIAKEGLEENQLHILLSIIKHEDMKNIPLSFEYILHKIRGRKLDDLLPPINFYSLVHMLKTFACPYGTLSHGTLRLSSMEFSTVVKKYYHNNSFAKKLKHWHMLLAAYYMTLCDPMLNKKWSGQSGSAFRNLPHHLLLGGCQQELMKILCSLPFIQSMLKMNAADEIMEYFVTLLQVRNSKTSVELNKFDFQCLEDYQNFISKNLHILKVYPFLIHQLALNENQDSLVYKASSWQNMWSMKCLTKSSSAFLTSTLDGFFKNVSCINSHPENPVAALGSDDGSVKILNIDTGKIVTSLKGHSSKVTSACFIGFDRICTASADMTLSIWSLSDNCRIAVLKGHTQYISSCCADLQDNIVSASWDHTICFWSSQDGRQISCIENLSFPVNTVSHHPQQQKIAIGLWNGNVEVWNTLSLKRENILYGNNGSIRCVRYSPNGLNIISATIRGSVLIWSTADCMKISKLEDHTLAVNCISCCSKGRVIVTGSDDTTLIVWPDQEQLTILTIKEFKDFKIHFMEIVSELHLAVAFQNNTICVFDINDGHVISKIDASADPPFCFSKFNGICDSKFVSTSSALIFGTRSGKVMKLQYESSSVSQITSVGSSVVVMLHTEYFILCGTTDGNIAVYILDGDLLLTEQLAHSNSITSLSVYTIGTSSLILSTSSDKMVKLWELVSGHLSLLYSYLSKHKDHIVSSFLFKKSVSCENSDATIITGSYDSSVIVWNGKKQLELKGLDSSITNLFYTGKFILACARDGSVAVWTKLGKLVSRTSGIEQSSAIFAIHFQKGKLKDFDATLAYVEMDGTILLKKPFNRFPLCTLQGHDKKITSCDINYKNVILSASLDKSVNIWKIPEMFKAYKLYHRGQITSTSLSSCRKLLLSGDINGNLVLWKVNAGDEHYCISYAVQRKYGEGSVNALLWINENKFVCAVSLHLKSEEKYVVEVFSCERPSDSFESVYIIGVIQQYHVHSEVTSMDYEKKYDVLAIGMKSGNVTLITSGNQKDISLVDDDWILKVKLFFSVDLTLCYADSNGYVGFSSNSTSNGSPNDQQIKKIAVVEGTMNSIPPLITALSCDRTGNFYVGDSSGNMTTLKENSCVKTQVHMASVTGIGVTETHLFTSSLDKTVKVWNLFNMNQVGLYHCSVPISCMSLSDESWNSNFKKSIYLILGTTVGDVHFLVWLPPSFENFR